MDDLFHQRAALFKALADPRRQEILDLLQNGELCACKLIEATGMVQSTLSYHMKILCQAGIVRGREAGKWTHYAIDPVGCAQAIGALEQLAASWQPAAVAMPSTAAMTGCGRFTTACISAATTSGSATAGNSGGKIS